MPLTVNLRHLEAHNLCLEDELPASELDIDTRDEMIQLAEPLKYDLEVQKLEDGLLVSGQLELTLNCQCVRCLKAFPYPLSLENWTTLIPLAGEEAVAVINDLVDLTPFVREDILLELPQHPLCDAECGGLPKTSIGKAKHTSSDQPKMGSPAWAELNKLKF